MKNIVTLLLFILPFTLFAQTDKKYMEGAVPVVDGKVTFSTEIKVSTLTQDQIHETLLEWANNRYKPTDKHSARVVYSNQEEGAIAIAGDEYIVFTSNALSLDRARTYYQLLLTSEKGKCTINISKIRYHYDEARNGGVKYVAENWITDEVALNKTKTKIYPIMGKFRRKTIDLKDDIIKDIQATLGNKMIALGVAPAPVTPAVAEVKPTMDQGPVQTNNQGFTVPTNEEDIIKQSVRMTIMAGNDEQFEINKECWGGYGELFGKKVTFCIIDTQKTMGNMLMSQSENYKISFYLANNNEPALVIDCKKLMQQTIQGEEAQKMSPNCQKEKSYNMYVGEIVK